jgi:hypothetical protein
LRLEEGTLEKEIQMRSCLHVLLSDVAKSCKSGVTSFTFVTLHSKRTDKIKLSLFKQ